MIPSFPSSKATAPAAISGAPASKVFDAAVAKVYGGKRRVVWFEVYAGEKAVATYGNDVWLPEDTLTAIKEYIVAIKGPLTTPIGGGIRSLNVTLRQVLNLYACVRPVSWVEGVPSPVKHPEKLNVIIFRENTEDVYAGIEWPAGSPEALKLIALFKEMGKTVRPDSGIGIKPISKTGTFRIVRKAIRWAVEHKLESVTLVHKGNIMKFTEGAFRDWGYECAATEFADVTVTEDDLWAKFDGKLPAGKVLIKDRIADSIFQQVLLRPDEYQVLCTPNLNGDYLSDACAAQIGGLGMAPGANISDFYAVFEATHGTAPKYADKDVINPGSRDSLRRHDVRLPRLARSRPGDSSRHCRRRQRQARHLRPAPPDGRRDQAEVQRVRRRDHQAHVISVPPPGLDPGSRGRRGMETPPVRCRICSVLPLRTRIRISNFEFPGFAGECCVSSCYDFGLLSLLQILLQDFLNCEDSFMKRVLLFGCWLLVALLLPSLVFAGTGKIAGHVVDQDDAEMIGVSVQIVGTTQGAATNLDGDYVILGVVPGSYTVKISAMGFVPQTFNGVEVSSDRRLP